MQVTNVQLFIISITNLKNYNIVYLSIHIHMSFCLKYHIGYSIVFKLIQVLNRLKETTEDIKITESVVEDDADSLGLACRFFF